MKINYSTVIIRLICIFYLSLLFTSCAPKAPDYPRLYSAYELRHHPKGPDGHPKGYLVLYSRTGFNSVDYVKKSDHDEYTVKRKAYDKHQKKKIDKKLKKEYGY